MGLCGTRSGLSEGINGLINEVAPGFAPVAGPRPLMGLHPGSFRDSREGITHPTREHITTARVMRPAKANLETSLICAHTKLGLMELPVLPRDAEATMSRFLKDSAFLHNSLRGGNVKNVFHRLARVFPHKALERDSVCFFRGMRASLGGEFVLQGLLGFYQPVCISVPSSLVYPLQGSQGFGSVHSWPPVVVLASRPLPRTLVYSAHTRNTTSGPDRKAK
jgi:hypothetical protein